MRTYRLHFVGDTALKQIGTVPAGDQRQAVRFERGAQGVPLTPGRSIAVDAQSVPYGTPVWLDTTEPLSNTPLRRLVMAQDTGSAITAKVPALAADRHACRNLGETAASVKM